ncbi:MAG: AI-2E family transporter [Erysipelotrichaceae bacterium]|nr:AI-2E family transporter [Erysipelotrichaceae bacterium]
MEKFKKEISFLKPWLILTTYAVILIFLMINFNSILTVINKYLILLNPLLMAIAISYVLNIPMKEIEKNILKRIKPNGIIHKNLRGISISLTLLLTIIILGFFGYIIIPQLIVSIVSLVNNLSNILNSIVNNTDAILKFFNLNPLDFEFSSAGINNFLNQFGLDVNKILNSLTGFVGLTSQSFLNYISKFVVTSANWFLAFMLSLYLLTGKETFIRQTKKIIAAIFSNKTTNRIMRYAQISNNVFSSFVTGQLVEALIIGILIYVALLITNMPYSLLIAAMASVLALVPVLGATIACIVGFLLVLSVSPIKAIWFVIIYQVIQQIEGTLIYPKVVGESVGLPGIWTLLSIIVFGGMYGVIGMLFAVPLTAIVYTTGSYLINKALDKKNIVVTTDEIKEKS